ncbi:MAG TPA: hypothetical protein VMT66_18090 [Steroidobacteraceae bacterium]|nr:hypothetical protein [Steroidobacteraceae bacterium]
MERGALRVLTAHSGRFALAALVALAAPVGCAVFASSSGRWDLFERSGSITTACGLLLASRRYIRYGVVELTLLHEQQRRAEVTEIVADIVTAKEGLALSAVGTIIWGWGAYLHWWSFGCLLFWAAFVVLHANRDLKDSSRLAAAGGAEQPGPSP